MPVPPWTDILVCAVGHLLLIKRKDRQDCLSYLYCQDVDEQKA